MRLNIIRRTSDPPELIERWRKRTGFQVFCDGQALSHCFAADTETGEAFCYEPSAYGQAVFRAEVDVEAIQRTGIWSEADIYTIRRTGKITIEEIPAAPTV